MSEFQRGHYSKLPKYPNLIGARNAAVKYIEKYISTHSMNLGSLSEEEFKKAMDAIMKAMLDSWIDGFESARE